MMMMTRTNGHIHEEDNKIDDKKKIDNCGRPKKHAKKDKWKWYFCVGNIQLVPSLNLITPSEKLYTCTILFQFKKVYEILHVTVTIKD